MKYKVIGITGPAHCGKDTAADHILKNMGYYKTSFADPLKRMLSVGLQLSFNQLYGDEKETIDPRYGCTPRHMMQTLGTEWGRNSIQSNIWVNALREHLSSTKLGFIIPDVRFEGEAEFIRENGILIHITGRDRQIPGDHQSELGVMLDTGVDLRISNSTTLECYYESLDSMILERLK